MVRLQPSHRCLYKLAGPTGFMAQLTRLGGRSLRYFGGILEQFVSQIVTDVAERPFLSTLLHLSFKARIKKKEMAITHNDYIYRLIRQIPMLMLIYNLVHIRTKIA